MKSQVNMTWNNMPHHHITFFFISPPRLWNHGLHFCHGMSWQIYMSWKKNLRLVFFLFSFNFVDKKVLTPFKHDVHVCIFTMIYMFINCTCTRYIKACIHQGLNHRPHGNTLKVLTVKPHQHFIKIDEKV
jgi:hypothetical protein